jgi:hypothetical protein
MKQHWPTSPRITRLSQNAIRIRDARGVASGDRAPVELGDPTATSPLRVVSSPGSGGPIETPILAEQGKEYIVRQLKLYASASGTTIVYGRMRISRGATDRG